MSRVVVHHNSTNDDVGILVLPSGKPFGENCVLGNSDGIPVERLAVGIGAECCGQVRVAPSVDGNKFDAVQRSRFEGLGQCRFAVFAAVDADNNGTASRRFVLRR